MKGEKEKGKWTLLFRLFYTIIPSLLLCRTMRDEWTCSEKGSAQPRGEHSAKEEYGTNAFQLHRLAMCDDDRYKDDAGTRDAKNDPHPRPTKKKN